MTTLPLGNFRAGLRGLSCLMVLCCRGLAASAMADTCRVATTGASDGAGGWADPLDLQTALATSACTEVWVKTRTYRPTTDSDRSISFHIGPGVAVYTGFAGSERQRSARAGGALYNLGHDRGRADPSVVIVTLIGNSAGSYGRALYNQNTASGSISPTLSHVIAWGNSAPSGPAPGSRSGCGKPSITHWSSRSTAARWCPIPACTPQHRHQASPMRSAAMRSPTRSVWR